jgi:hypothetical protein
MKTLIETVAGQLSTPNTFHYCEEYELNFLADGVETWPAIALFPIIYKKKKMQNGQIRSACFTQMLFVNKTEFLASSEDEKLPILEALEGVIDEFIERLSTAMPTQLFKFTDIEFQLVPAANQFDVNVDGYYVEAELVKFSKVCL